MDLINQFIENYKKKINFYETAGRIAAEEGAPYLCGGHIAHWSEWTGEEYFLAWDPSTGVTTQEGYLQLRRYFTAWAGIVRENGWEGRMTQALADEPQQGNSRTYRILACIFRRFLPGVPIIDAVETTDLGGGIDIWVPKQDTYEKWQDAFRTLQDAGEEIWFYTCAFPHHEPQHGSSAYRKPPASVDGCPLSPLRFSPLGL